MTLHCKKSTCHQVSLAGARQSSGCRQCSIHQMLNSIDHAVEACTLTSAPYASDSRAANNSYHEGCLVLPSALLHEGPFSAFADACCRRLSPIAAPLGQRLHGSRSRIRGTCMIRMHLKYCLHSDNLHSNMRDALRNCKQERALQLRCCVKAELTRIQQS